MKNIKRLICKYALENGIPPSTSIRDTITIIALDGKISNAILNLIRQQKPEWLNSDKEKLSYRIEDAKNVKN